MTSTTYKKRGMWKPRPIRGLTGAVTYREHVVFGAMPGELAPGIRWRLRTRPQLLILQGAEHGDYEQKASSFANP